MNRRSLLRGVSAISLLSFFPIIATRSARAASTITDTTFQRVRPSDQSWPSLSSWETLNQAVGGRLVRVTSPVAGCLNASSDANCSVVFKNLKNPYYIGDEAGITQTLGWTGAWTSQPSEYAVVAQGPEDVVAAVNFARENKLRLVVKGGGHSYQGTSNAADSLLIWTRNMNAIAFYDAFVGLGCEGKEAPRQAVTVGAGAIWMQAYSAVTTKKGRYVQGGGCNTVGVAGLIQSGGFGSFSKKYGIAAASLLEAEVVTADGVVRIANACMNPDLFWGLKGGGGGSLGVVTKLTLQTYELPTFFGGVSIAIRAFSDSAFRQLIGRVMGFYRENLFNPNWGEQIFFKPGNAVVIRMVFQGLDQQQAETVWRPFLEWVSSLPQEFNMISPPRIIAVPAKRFWDPEFLKKLSGIVLADDRPAAPDSNVFWAGDAGETGQVLHGYQSAWLPATLLQDDQRHHLSDTLFAATRHWEVALHFNKGLAGAAANIVAAASNTATNPDVLDAFALAICAAGGPPAYPGIPTHEPDLDASRKHALAIGNAMFEIRKLAPSAGSYVSEGNFFENEWQQKYWGANYARLLKVKEKYDPDGLFFVHHGVGTEHWSFDGFTRLT